MTKGRQGSYKYFRGSSAGGDLILSGWNLDDTGNDVCGAVITKEGQGALNASEDLRRSR